MVDITVVDSWTDVVVVAIVPLVAMVEALVVVVAPPLKSGQIQPETKTIKSNRVNNLMLMN